MSVREIPTLDVRSRDRWRQWLEEHHDSVSAIWLVFHKRHTGIAGISYEDAIEEALCFGWVDSLVQRLDESRFARKFTPRKADSKWSTSNRRRYKNLKSRGMLAAPGLSRPPTDRNGDAPRPRPATLPAYIEEQLKTNARAWNHFQQLAPSCRRAYIAWIDSARRDETKQRRLSEAIRMLAAGKKFGLK